MAMIAALLLFAPCRNIVRVVWLLRSGSPILRLQPSVYEEAVT